MIHLRLTICESIRTRICQIRYFYFVFYLTTNLGIVVARNGHVEPSICNPFAGAPELLHFKWVRGRDLYSIRR